ncbi:F-box protein CPR30-like [Chenopodium quinoa]|uniref:F-box protein CPR30-like n=1 Tax=Chenopodium quinoa TaxID=63459 RepID=UPI000B78EF53|nr:F-box protein CPR30-like [Chenopodium quinoa]
MSSPPQSPPHKKLKSTTEDPDEETQNNETQNSETQNRETQNSETRNNETQNSETQNRETQNNETQNSETQNNETQNSETQNREIQNRETQNREIPKHMILKFLSETQNREIPDHVILTEILPRLPADSLLRFKQVCKEWELLISSPEFINDHAFRPNPLSSRSVLSIAHDSSLTAIDYEDLSTTHFGLYSSVNPIALIGSCNGLVLLISAHAPKGKFLLYFKYDFRVFNPVLGAPGITIFPPPNFIWSIHYAANDYSFGFGYSSTHKEFYIAAINFPHTLLLPGIVVFLYNLSTTKWSTFHVPRTAWRYIEEQRMFIAVQEAWYKHSGTLVNEALHWSVVILGNNIKCIVVFDLVSKKVTFMKLPYAYFGDPAILTRSAFSLCCLNNCLCAWAYSRDGRLVDLWMMKEYGVQKPWTRLFSGDMKSTYWYFFGLTC